MIRHVSLSFSLNPADSNHVQPQVSPLGWWLPSGGLSSSYIFFDRRSNTFQHQWSTSG